MESFLSKKEDYLVEPSLTEVLKIPPFPPLLKPSELSKKALKSEKNRSVDSGEVRKIAAKCNSERTMYFKKLRASHHPAFFSGVKILLAPSLLAIYYYE